LRVELLEQRSLLSAAPVWPGLTSPALEVEPNDTALAAQPLGDLTGSAPAQIAGTVRTVGDVDWYSFTVDQAAEITVQAHAQTPGGASPVISLYNSDPFNDPYDLVGYRLLAQSGGPGDPFIDRAVGGPGTYYVAVSGAGDRHFNPNLANSGEAGATGDYGLIVNATNTGPAPSGPPGVLSADVLAGPTPDATSARSPFEIHVNLSGPLDPSVQGNLSDLNVTLTAAGDPTNLVGNVSFGTDANDLLITPVSALAPGDYDLSVAAMTFSGFQALNQDFTQHFTVTGIEGQATADDTAATAHDLGDVSTAGLVQSAGAIGDDPAYNPASTDPKLNNPAADVDMYHFTISGAGNYSLITEVFAGRVGSPLNPALTLYRRDPLSGQLVLVAFNNGTTNATPDVNGNMPLFSDPALLTGLTAGDYYLAVSSAPNFPDPNASLAPGASVFDPNVSHSGTLGKTTGEYVLNLRVSQDNTAPQVVSTSLAEGSTLGAPPTQLTVQFSEPVNLQQLGYDAEQRSGPAQGQLAAVFFRGSDGVLYYPRLISFDTTTNTATFMMLDGLPTGPTELHLSGAGGLKDLAGNPLAGNDQSGDYVVRFMISGPTRPTFDTSNGPTQGQYVWHDQEPNDSATQPQVVGTLFPDELQKGIPLNGVTQKGVAFVRDFTANPSAAPSDTGDYYQFQLLQSRPYFFILSGTNLPAGTVPVLINVTDPANPRVVPTLRLAGGIRLANLDPGVYVISVSGWTKTNAANVTYNLTMYLGGSVENPTPLTAGPAPAFRIRLPDPSAPAPQPQPTGSSGSSGGQQAPAAVTQTPPAGGSTTTSTASTLVGPTGTPRLVLPSQSGNGGAVPAATAAIDTGAAATLTTPRLHVTSDATRGPDLPTGALLSLSYGALGGVRLPDGTDVVLNPLQLILPAQAVAGPSGTPAIVVSIFSAPEATNADRLPALVENPERPPDTPGVGFMVPGGWLTWPLSQLIWGWITSPLLFGLPLDGAVPATPTGIEDLEAALSSPQAAGAGDAFAVNGAWASALLAAGTLSVFKADEERVRGPAAAPRRRTEDGDAAR
jgi:hypothetical protein